MYHGMDFSSGALFSFTRNTLAAQQNTPHLTKRKRAGCGVRSEYSLSDAP